MTQEIKVIDCESLPLFEKSVNKLLKKGWKIKGSLVRGTGYKIMLYRLK